MHAPIRWQNLNRKLPAIMQRGIICNPVQHATGTVCDTIIHKTIVAANGGSKRTRNTIVRLAT